VVVNSSAEAEAEAEAEEDLASESNRNLRVTAHVVGRMALPGLSAGVEGL